MRGVVIQAEGVGMARRLTRPPSSLGFERVGNTHRAKKPSSGAVDALLSLPFAENGFKEQGQRETANFP